MKLTILVDNNTLINKNFLGEAGLSIFIEIENKKIIFDVGYSDIFIKNASKMGINLKEIDYLIFSHGHNDHSWGLFHFIEYCSAARVSNKPTIITHPLTFEAKHLEGVGEIGNIIEKEKLSSFFNIKYSKKPYWITEKLVFLGEIPRNNEFEGKTSIGQVYKNGIAKNDYIIDDSALAYKSEFGLVIITGCSHSGICNITEYAKKVCEESKVFDIVGGFHLLAPVDNQLLKTVKYLSDIDINQLHPCHCTDLQSKIELAQKLNVKEVGVGLELKYD